MNIYSLDSCFRKSEVPAFFGCLPQINQERYERNAHTSLSILKGTSNYQEIENSLFERYQLVEGLITSLFGILEAALCPYIFGPSIPWMPSLRPKQIPTERPNPFQECFHHNDRISSAPSGSHTPFFVSNKTLPDSFAQTLCHCPAGTLMA